MNLVYFWIGVMVTFLIIEMLTATFYGLSISLASLVVALYVWGMNIHELTIEQAGIFALISFVASYFLPRLLISEVEDTNTNAGMNVYIGEKRKIKKVGESLKISLDGVDYLIQGEDISVGDQVEVMGSEGIIFLVKKVQK